MLSWAPASGLPYGQSAIASVLLFVAAGALVALPILLWLIAKQRRDNVGQHIYEDSPKTHATKQGTPTLGGLAFIAAALVGLVLSRVWRFEINLFLLMLSCGMVGLADDLLIMHARRALGLRARVKFLLITLIAVLFVVFNRIPQASGQYWFGGQVHLPYALWFVLAVLAIVGSANAVNLTDGIDGLAAGATIPTLLALQLSIVPAQFLSGGSGIGWAVLGACVVFLWFNRNPARIFMGDTGSLALGALLAGTALDHHLLLLLPLFGIIFVVEALSVMLQVLSYKSTGKRIFKMSPLHHHFELSGWRESTVSSSFIAIHTIVAGASWVSWWWLYCGSAWRQNVR